MNKLFYTIVFTALSLMGSTVSYAAPSITPKSTKFDPNTTALPKNYKGEDPGNLFHLFIQNADVPPVFDGLSKFKRPRSTEKSEFETTTEYSSRRAKTASALLPPNSLYALSSDGTSFSYDADKGLMTMNTSAVIRDGRSYISLKALRRQYSEYVASNAYGARTKVTKLDVEQVFVGGRETSPIHKALYRTGEVLYGSYILELPVDLKEAKRWKAKHISALFIGRIDGNSLTQVLFKWDQPTISNPNEFTSVSWGIPFAFAHVIIYLRDTGEIIKKIDFTTADET